MMIRMPAIFMALREPDPVMTFDASDEDFQETFRGAARAVLEAVREPSKTMCEVGANWLISLHKEPRGTAQDVRREMVNAAIEEE
jgi:DNA repair protein RadC